jgi:ATP-dependent DNA helicase RecQ
MSVITFIDTEVEPASGKILDIGAVKDKGATFHSSCIQDFSEFIKGSEFLAGHNILNHDLKFLKPYLEAHLIRKENCIDTLYLSPLLFPARPYHSLVKDDKLQSDDLNNPLNDSIKAQELFDDEVAAFKTLPVSIQKIFYGLLRITPEFGAFFRFLNFHVSITDIYTEIKSGFHGEICENADLEQIVSRWPIETAYSLALINARNRYSITPRWVLKNYPQVQRVYRLLRNTRCLTGCAYCNAIFDVKKGLYTHFKYDNFRNFDGEPLQEKAVKAAVDNQSLLAIFPTGGGKSLTFQLPALIAGETEKGLTVVISPLQSLMKDQVDNLAKLMITDAVAINGLLDPIEKAKAIERIQAGDATLLYISPESLRSRTIEHLLHGRKISRFVIDEAHCFSSWGQDFRVDYLYIGDFIKSLQKHKNLDEKIPVSCFTATAKLQVIEDISTYFQDKLGLELKLFTSHLQRTNLHYSVIEKENEDEKYQKLRDLIEEKDCPAIIYVSRTHKCTVLAERLSKDGFQAVPFHGKMDSKDKARNQDEFIAGKVKTIVATSAFGMGVDKKDVGLVIHYDISDSLENYVQEAGRAGRDEHMQAECYVLFNDDDLGKHFIMLNQTKLSIKEIKQVWRAIKLITKFRSKLSNSALEIARKAGWDEHVSEIETRVKSAIAALEDAKMIKRGQNIPLTYANSILTKTLQEAIDKINSSVRFESDNQKIKAIRIIKKLIASKNRKEAAGEVAEARVDYISDHLGIVKADVISIINLLREEMILADAKDLQAFIYASDSLNQSLNLFEKYRKLELFLLNFIKETEQIVNIKELKQQFDEKEAADQPVSSIRTILNFWAIKNWIKKHLLDYSRNNISILGLVQVTILEEKFEKRFLLSRFILEYLFNKINPQEKKEEENKTENLIDFSVLELKTAFLNQGQLFQTKVDNDDIEDSLFYLTRIEALKIEGGFMVTYNKLSIERLEQNTRKDYVNEHYQKLNQFYENRIQQIHIVGEYAKKMLDDYQDALKFVDDYFNLNYSSFLNQYFPGSRQNEIKRNLTPAKYRQLFEALTPTQREVIDDKETACIVVAAGPGSGKTKLLVHKLASLMLMEDVKHEQLMMVTFSRAAAMEFKKRLMNLIGNAAAFIDIKTFHSFCFDILGRPGSIDKSDKIIQTAIEKIRKDEVEISRITKTVLVIDEAQDMDIHEFTLVNLLKEKNEEMRIIAVGDDDQNIYSFRGSDSKYMKEFLSINNARKYELTENFRSKRNLVEFTNQVAAGIRGRLKKNAIVPVQNTDGNIKIVTHEGKHLIEPLINDLISNGLSGSTCILTQTNEEAIQITGMLIKLGRPAKLIQSHDEFNLYNLNEIRFFLEKLKFQEDDKIVQDEQWQQAKTELLEKFSRSTKLEFAIKLVRDFEETNIKRKYRSDLDNFIRESKLEDLYSDHEDVILVSTIHKSKGKEFENVFLMLNNFDISKEENKRQLYVGLTRAKSNLTIHYNSHFLEQINVPALERIHDPVIYAPEKEMHIHLTHRDVNLGYFEFVQRRIFGLMAGDMLNVTNEGCLNQHNELIVKFSKSFQDRIASFTEKGFSIKEGRINFIVYWYDEKSDKEVKIVLPEVMFTKKLFL